MAEEPFDTSMLIRDVPREPGFPHAPIGWTRAEAEATATREGLALTEDHWEVVRGLQSYFARNGAEGVNMRALHDALDEKFHVIGGLRRLYELLPGGPIAQGCRLAGLKAPHMASDGGFGSVA